MSYDVLKIIPSSPVYVPDENEIKQALVLLRGYTSNSDNINVVISDFTRFIDQGVNWERIICPFCNSIIEIDWWQTAMGESYNSKYENLVFPTPCCNKEISLNDLKYEWPAGFAKFSIEIRNPERDIPDPILKKLESIFGTQLRIIRAHY